MKLFQLALLSAVMGLFLLVGNPAHAVYTQTVIATGGEPFSGAQLSFTTSSGEKGEIQRDENDDRKIMILLPDGAKGSSGTLTVTRGGQSTNIPVSLAGGPVMVNTGTGLARAGRPRISDRYDISFGLFGLIGQSVHSPDIDFGGSSESFRSDVNLLKLGFGGNGRIGFPKEWLPWSPIFLDMTFAYFPGNQSSDLRGNQSSRVRYRENWRSSVMLGFTPWRRQAMAISLLAGIAIINAQTSFGLSNMTRDTSTKVAPSVGFEFATPLGAVANLANMATVANTGMPLWFFAGALDILGKTHVRQGNSVATLNGNVQYQILTGFRFPL